MPARAPPLPGTSLPPTVGLSYCPGPRVFHNPCPQGHLRQQTRHRAMSHHNEEEDHGGQGSEVNSRIRKEGSRERADARLGRGSRPRAGERAAGEKTLRVARNGSKLVLAWKESIGWAAEGWARPAIRRGIWNSRATGETLKSFKDKFMTQIPVCVVAVSGEGGSGTWPKRVLSDH